MHFHCWLQTVILANRWKHSHSFLYRLNVLAWILRQRYTESSTIFFLLNWAENVGDYYYCFYYRPNRLFCRISLCRRSTFLSERINRVCTRTKEHRKWFSSDRSLDANEYVCMLSEVNRTGWYNMSSFRVTTLLDFDINAFLNNSIIGMCAHNMNEIGKMCAIKIPSSTQSLTATHDFWFIFMLSPGAIAYCSWFVRLNYAIERRYVLQ